MSRLVVSVRDREVPKTDSSIVLLVLMPMVVFTPEFQLVFQETSGERSVRTDSESNHASSARAGCDSSPSRPVRISWPPIRPDYVESLASEGLKGLDHFKDGCANTCSQITNKTLIVFQVFHCLHMSLGEIGDMDIIPDTASVARIIIGSKHLQVGALARGGFHDKGDQVFWIDFQTSHLKVWVISGSVEITQRCEAQPF